MKAFISIFLVALALSNYSRGEKVAELQEPFSSVFLAIDKNQFYVADRRDCTIHIYSLKDYSHIGQIGRKGQGPAEFEFIGYIRIYPEYIFVYSGLKVSYFSKNGKYLKTATPSLPTTSGYIPLGLNYVGEKYIDRDPRERFFQKKIVLLDSKFKEKKEVYLAELHKVELYNYKDGKKDILMVKDCFKYDVYNDMVYIGDANKGLFFIVVDMLGNRLHEISLSDKKLKISSNDKKKILDELREEVGEDKFNNWKKTFNYVFPEYYPAYFDFIVADTRLYVFSYPAPDSPLRVMTLDLHGNVIKTTILHSIPRSSYVQQYYCIYENKLYFLYYNDETYKWELHYELL
jgi:hypothetical protein